MNDSPFHSVPTDIPSQRVLQRYTSAAEEYGFFFVDERRKVFFMLDRIMTTAPRIYCQEIATGRRLKPVIDTELGGYDDFLELKGATLSACGQYMGTMYSWHDTDGTSIYTAVWQIAKCLDFSGTKPALWAQKINSLCMAGCSKGIDSTNPIAFGNDGSMYCPHGRVNLASGAHEPAFGARAGREPLDILISGDSRGAVVVISDANEIADVSPEGEFTTIYSYETGHVVVLGTLSNSGRFLTWDQTSAEQASRRYIYDKVLQTVEELIAPLEGEEVIEHSERYHFTKDERTLLLICETFDSRNQAASRVIMWRRYDSLFCLWAEQTIRGSLLGHCLDESSGHLYIVQEKRIWSRIDLNTDDLPNLDSELDELKITRTESGISQDGARMIIIRQQIETSEVQVLVLNTIVKRCCVMKDPRNQSFSKDEIEMKNPWNKSYSRDEIQVNTQLLDLEQGITTRLDSPTIHSTSFVRDAGVLIPYNASIHFAACGTYAFLNKACNPDAICKIRSRIPPSKPSFPKVLPSQGSGGADPMSIFVFGAAVQRYTIEDISACGEPPETMRRLTIVPEHLKGAEVTFLLGVEEHDPSLRVLFSTHDGNFELKHLEFKLSHYMDWLQKWCDDSAQRDRALGIAEGMEDALDDSFDESESETETETPEWGEVE
ncbi:MAG: hypothetical protein Q9226_007746 [Calogaya cf. arnoldii]